MFEQPHHARVMDFDTGDRHAAGGRFFFSRSSLAMGHFFNSAGQLRTTVIGGDPASSDVFSRKRCPSAETPYDCRSSVTLSSV
jgi:hypothetical protein